MFLLKRMRFIQNIMNGKLIARNISSNDSFGKEVEHSLTDDQFNQIYPQSWTQMRLVGGHNVLLIVPRQNYSEQKIIDEQLKHLTDETKALINTLPNWRVIDTLVINAKSFKTNQIFGSGNLEMVKNKCYSKSISTIVFGIDMLTNIQLAEMQQQFGVEVYDRYTVILQIFKDHARTPEAKLQIALAELPYIKYNYETSFIQSNTSKLFGVKTPFERRKLILHEREKKLNHLLKKLKTSRQINKLNRTRKELPTVAVVGYTNGGKTSLIKALTNDNHLIPKDQLFATLDVTVHNGRLPNNMQVLYLDTIGFISNIPISLIKSFNVTLGDICEANLIVHVSDLSHPSYALQNKTVHQTLDIINIPQKLKDTMIEVANKIDLINDQNLLNSCDKIPISATKTTGISHLANLIEQKIIINTERMNKIFRVSNGGDDYQWLCRNSVVRNTREDSNDSNYLLLDVFITKSAFSKFIHQFPKSYN